MIVDIHNHILPGLDDGPKGWDEMVLLSKQAVNTGITNVIATPHHKHQHKDHYYVNNPTNICHLVTKANQLLMDKNIPLEIHPGIEFHIHPKIIDDIEERLEDFLTLNDTKKYMLMEPPCSYYPEQTEEICNKLLERGMVPVIAHPERNRVIRNNPEIIYRLVQMGVLVQITAESIIGTGRRLKNFSRHLLDHDLVHFIASDAHHFSRRKFELRYAYQFVEERYSIYLRTYFENNARYVLDGTEIEKIQPRLIGKRKQYFFFYNHPLNKY